MTASASDLAADLELATACTVPGASGERARERVTERCRPLIRRVAQKYVPGDVDDFEQELLGMLCVPGYRGDKPCLLTQYSATAPLEAWVASVAIRRALNRAEQLNSPLRRTQPLTDRPAAERREAPSEALIRQLRAAVIESVGRLDPATMLALKLALVDGASLEQVAAVAYQGRVSVPTASRRVREAKDAFRAGLEAAISKHVLSSPDVLEREKDLDHVVRSVLPTLDLAEILRTEVKTPDRAPVLKEDGET